MNINKATAYLGVVVLSLALIFFIASGSNRITAGNSATSNLSALHSVTANVIRLPLYPRSRSQRTRLIEERKAKAKAKAKLKRQKELELYEDNLPADTSTVLTLKEVRVNGNTLVSTEVLLYDIPLVYNTSPEAIDQAQSNQLYDLRKIVEVIDEPNEPREVSSRAIQGFTQYLLSVYQSYNYAGIYVYVPAESIQKGKLLDDILTIEILEAPVSDVSIKSYDLQGKTEKSVLRRSLIEKWSPIKVGQVGNQKKLDDFINLLNLNPDRYVSATVSKGAEPKTLAVGYDIYETDPWHYFAHVDNSGHKDRRWTPRIGAINTNLTGMDDKFTATYQSPFDSTANDNYSYFGSYDFPVFTQRLRLSLYAGRSKFDVSSEASEIDFLGKGSFYGSVLRWNLLQKNGWFFDVRTSLSHERSKVSSSLFPSALASKVSTDIWGLGVDLHRSDDMSKSYFTASRNMSISGSGKSKFENARTGTDPDYIIYSAAASHSQYLDPNKVQRLNAVFRGVTSNKRLIPAKMTTFGGMYSVRGYQEDEIVADGGILLSLQYEFDLVRYFKTKTAAVPEENVAGNAEKKKPWLKRLAPLAFVDYGRAKLKKHVAGEKNTQKLYSVGLGVVTEMWDYLDIAVYYGHPLRSTAETRKGDDRFNVSIIARW
jgi:hemolysin activation/secretion protein